MKKRIIAVLLSTMVMTSMASGCVFAEEVSANSGVDKEVKQTFAGGSGTLEDPYQIANAAQLLMVQEDLSANYILTADIDMSDYESIDPIGHFEPKSDAEEDAETPKEDAAYTGMFDGNGHKISNVTISDQYENGVGLFGCVTGEDAGIKDLTVENIVVDGKGSYVGCVVGYAYYDVDIEQIRLIGENECIGAFLIGGIVGASHADIKDCEATAQITLVGEDAQGAGIIVGGAEDCNIENCTASGSVTATDSGAYSVGGLAGCFHVSEFAKNCVAKDLVVKVGKDAAMVGGLAGHAGTFEGEPTQIENCRVENVTIEAQESAERIGGIVGGGFYLSAYKEYYPEPAAFEVLNCTLDHVTILAGEKAVGSVIGYAYNNCIERDNEGTVDGLETIGATDQELPLDQIR